jgi:hypothetical protein
VRNIFEAIGSTSTRENNDEKEMNWPDDDFIFQQQKIAFCRRRLSFFLSFFFFSRMYIRLSANTNANEHMK